MQQVFGVHSYGIPRAGRPHTPQQRDTKSHPTIREEDLIKKSELLDPLEDDDDIVWKHNPFDIDSVTESGETPDQDHFRRVNTTSDQAEGFGSGIH